MTEIRASLGAVDTVEKCGDVDELVSRIDEILVENLLAGHDGVAFTFGGALLAGIIVNNARLRKPAASLTLFERV